MIRQVLAAAAMMMSCRLFGENEPPSFGSQNLVPTTDLLQRRRTCRFRPLQKITTDLPRRKSGGGSAVRAMHMSPAKRAQAGGDRPAPVLSTVMESTPQVFKATRPIRYPIADNVTSAGPALLEPRSHKVAGFQCDDTTESTRDDSHMSACAALGRSPTLGDRLDSARTNKGRLREPNRCYACTSCWKGAVCRADPGRDWPDEECTLC